MSKSNHTLTKTCINCGLQKPLSAFLQFGSSGMQGATYGNMCASCRKAHQDKAGTNKEHEDKTKREIGGSRIRATERLAGEIDKKNQRGRIENLYRQEQEKNTQQKSEETQKTETHIASEKKHRQSYDQVKRSFLDANKTKGTTEHLQIFSSEQQKPKEGEVTQQEVSAADSFGKEKFKTTAFRQFIDTLGITRTTDATKKKAPQNAGEKRESTPQSAGEEKEESIPDYIKRTWGPK